MNNLLVHRTSIQRQECHKVADEKITYRNNVIYRFLNLLFNTTQGPFLQEFKALDTQALNIAYMTMSNQMQLLSTFNQLLSS